jgi:hypothetical protein
MPVKAAKNMHFTQGHEADRRKNQVSKMPLAKPSSEPRPALKYSKAHQSAVMASQKKRRIGSSNLKAKSASNGNEMVCT